MSSAELTEWRAYYHLEPFGDVMADQRHGILTSVLANVNRDAKRRPEPYKPVDFIYWHEAHGKEDRSQLLADPQAQSDLIKRSLFRKVAKRAR